MASLLNTVQLKTVSFNMHGFNQGFNTVRHLIDSISPDVFMLQEHWLTPANLNKFDDYFPEYFPFGSSAMENSVGLGPLVGRPYGGVLILIKECLRSVTQCLYRAERCAIVKVGDSIFANVYFPCDGTADRLLVCSDLLAILRSWTDEFPLCQHVIGGDFNVNLKSNCNISTCINDFLNDIGLTSCDKLFPVLSGYTYFNEILNHYSIIDYILVSDVKNVLSFEALDIGVNLSDHLPILSVCLCDISVSRCSNKQKKLEVNQMRWDHADLLTYYFNTMHYLQPVLSHIDELDSSNCSSDEMICEINNVYNDVINALHCSANGVVPTHKENYYKFWWSQDLSCLKDNAIKSHKLWKAAGKPRSGLIFQNYQSDKSLFKKRIREAQLEETWSYSNELHDALLQKSGNTFWKCWKSKFNNQNLSINQVNGLVDEQQIANKFADHFSKACSNFSNERNSDLKQQYNNMRSIYDGFPYTADYWFDVELIDKVITELKRGKAAGLDNLTAEHLQHSHPLLTCILVKLFNLMMLHGHVLPSFGESYTIPLPKGDGARCAVLTVDDFRGISISPVLSKVFEYCILERFKKFFNTADNQFGFKKNLSCAHAIYSVRSVVDYYVAGGSTVNICALDLAKAFDKTNHCALFMKLMKRKIPLELLQILEKWLNSCFTCVKWCGQFSQFFKLNSGVRQGGVLSPYLFAIYVDDIINNINASSAGCELSLYRMSIFMYADDIILIAPSITSLQYLLKICESELAWLDMHINNKKSMCMRIGPRFDVSCANLTTVDGQALEWVKCCRYLGVYIVNSRKFKCSFEHAKTKFYRAFNAIFGKIGRTASEEVLIKLINSKCLPIIMYGLEACPINNTAKKSLDFPITRIFMKMFCTTSIQIVEECQAFFGFIPIRFLADIRTVKFLDNFCNLPNYICSSLLANIAKEQSNEICNRYLVTDYFALKSKIYSNLA
jgi:exonuclease III